MIHHPFRDAPGAVDLFQGTNTFDEFIKKLNDLSKTLPAEHKIPYGKNPDFDKNGKSVVSEKDKNKILGDGFELFTELLISILGAHPHIGIGNYRPFGQEEGEEDQGIDGYGTNIEGKRTAIQCKFTNDPAYEFTANGSNLGNFLIEAALEGLLAKGQLYLFTTAKGIHWYTAKKWRHTVIEFTREKISSVVDNNELFWKRATELLLE